MKKLKSLVAVLMAMAFMLLLAGCGDKEDASGNESSSDSKATAEYIYDVVDRVPVGESYDKNGLKAQVRNVEISVGVNGALVSYQLVDDVEESEWLEKNMDDFAYADGRIVTSYVKYVDKLYRDDDVNLINIVRASQTFMFDVGKGDVDLNVDHSYELEVHPTWNGWPQNESVVFELN